MHNLLGPVDDARIFNFVQVFPPSFHELPPPALDLFDLDEHFSSERVRVAQITNKCKPFSSMYMHHYIKHSNNYYYYSISIIIYDLCTVHRLLHYYHFI